MPKSVDHAQCATPDRAGLALLLAFGIAANLVELAIPRIPLLPWLRLGLAQVFTLAVIVLYSPMEGVRFSVLRTVVAGFLSGMPLTSFLFSGLAGIASAGVMGALWYGWGKRGLLGVVGISVVGAAIHNLAQIAIAYGLFVRSSAFLWQLPWALLFSLVSGGVVGLLAMPVLRSFNGTRAIAISSPPLASVRFSTSRKILFGALFLSFAGAFLVNHWAGLLGLFGLLTPLLINLRVSLKECCRAALRFWGLFFWIVLTALVFTPGQYLVPPITLEGLNLGIVLSLRLFFCILISIVLQKTGGMQWALSALCRRTGGDSLEIMNQAMAALPVLAAIAKRMRWRLFAEFDRAVEESLAALKARSDSV